MSVFEKGVTVIEKAIEKESPMTENAIINKKNDEIVESEAVELFMLDNDDRDERLKAHYRQGEIIDGKWVNSTDDDAESNDKPDAKKTEKTIYKVYTLQHGGCVKYSNYFGTLEDALENYNVLVSTCFVDDTSVDVEAEDGIYLEKYTHNDENFDEMKTDYDCECIEYTRTI